MSEQQPKSKTSGAGDDVEHPAHYSAHPSGVECITIVEHMTFNVGNAIKYLWRAGRKEGTEHETDLRKALWYVRRELVRLGYEHESDHQRDSRTDFVNNARAMAEERIRRRHAELCSTLVLEQERDRHRREETITLARIDLDARCSSCRAMRRDHFGIEEKCVGRRAHEGGSFVASRTDAGDVEG